MRYWGCKQCEVLGGEVALLLLHIRVELLETPGLPVSGAGPSFPGGTVPPVYSRLGPAVCC
jgi:hypothetical protein